MELPELTCGIAHMLDHAIWLHNKANQGRAPRRIELHPSILPELYADPLFERDRDWTKPYSFHGVDIVINAQANAPALITCRNEVQYL